MKVKIGSLITVVLMLVNMLSVPMYAEVLADSEYSYYLQAKQLEDIGVFRGSDYGLELGKEPTRIEGLVILIRLLGKEEEAKNMSNESCEFTDVPDWALGYVNFAKKEGLTTGTGEGVFGTNDPLAPKAFVTFMLRALGYKDSEGDFTYDGALEYAKEMGLLEDLIYVELTEDVFNRNLVAKVSYNTLLRPMKGDTRTLAAKLIDEGSITSETIRSAQKEDTVSSDENEEDTINSKSSVDDEKDSDELDISLLGTTTITPDEVKAWAASKGMSQEGQDMVDIYYDVCESKGLNPVVQYVQMCLETGWLYKNGSGVGLNATYHNPCGMKTSTAGEANTPDNFIVFDSWEDGIDAHTDHSALYAGVEGYPREDSLDPRHFSFLFGAGSTVRTMAAKWAPVTDESNGNASYPDNIIRLYTEIETGDY